MYITKRLIKLLEVDLKTFFIIFSNLRGIPGKMKGAGIFIRFKFERKNEEMRLSYARNCKNIYATLYGYK